MNKSPTQETLTIGKVADRAGIGVETIRFYEREKGVSTGFRKNLIIRLFSSLEDILRKHQVVVV